MHIFQNLKTPEQFQLEKDMFITTKYDGLKVKKKRSLTYRLFRLFHRGPFGDEMERASEMGKDDPSDIIIVSGNEHDDK